MASAEATWTRAARKSPRAWQSDRVVQACKHTRTLLDVKSTQEAADGRILHCTGDLCTEVRGTDTTPSWEREGSHTDMHAHARVRAETDTDTHTASLKAALFLPAHYWPPNSPVHWPGSECQQLRFCNFLCVLLLLRHKLTALDTPVRL